VSLDELVVDVRHVLDGAQGLDDGRLVGVRRHFAGDQHDAVVARHVHVAALADRCLDLVARLQLDRLVLDLRAGAATVGEHHRSADRGAAHDRDAPLEGAEERGGEGNDGGRARGGRQERAPGGAGREAGGGCHQRSASPRS
jgi:hypothetical protein